MNRPLQCTLMTMVRSTLLTMALAGMGFTQINARRINQQDRIAQGIRSGQLTAGETARLENQESRINHEVRRDRAANGGRLTPCERAQVNRQLNRESARIYRAKHNGAGKTGSPCRSRSRYGHSQ
jgi:hypothetical protein